MSIPEDWRGILDPGTENIPFWTLYASDLRGRFSGRAAKIAYQSRTSRSPAYLYLIVDCPVRGLFRMVPPGGLAPTMPLSSTFKDFEVGEAELDRQASFWSDDEGKLPRLIQQRGVRKALAQIIGLTERGFSELSLQNGQLKAIHVPSGVPPEGPTVKRGLSALAVVAEGVEKVWPADPGNKTWKRTLDSGWGCVLVAVAIFLLALAVRVFQD